MFNGVLPNLVVGQKKEKQGKIKAHGNNCTKGWLRRFGAFDFRLNVNTVSQKRKIAPQISDTCCWPVKLILNQKGFMVQCQRNVKQKLNYSVK